MADELTGRTAVVTGAGGGIGRATALALARLGAAVVVNDIGRARDGTRTAETVCDEIERAGGRAVANLDSVADFEGAARIVACAQRAFGAADILINNAGLAWQGQPEDLGPDEFRRILASHVDGSFFCARHALPAMRERRWGRIVNLVSRAGLLGMPRVLAYGVAKGGVFGLTNTLSRDVAGSGVTVNAVNPSSTETPLIAEALVALEAAGPAERQRAANLRAQMQSPDQVAALITALCLPNADAINGQIFYVERNRVGLFQPLTVTQQVERDAPWSAGDLARAIADFQWHGLGDAYS